MGLETRLMSAAVLLSCAVLVPVICSSANATADTEASLPMRKAGMWSLKTVMDEGRGPRENELKICISDDMEKNTVAASMLEHRTKCTTYEIKKNGEEVHVTADGCEFNRAKVTSETVMSGDFQTAFSVTIKSTTVHANGDQSVSIKRDIAQTGTYVGTDCGDLEPGQAMGTDGNKIFVQ